MLLAKVAVNDTLQLEAVSCLYVS